MYGTRYRAHSVFHAMAGAAQRIVYKRVNILSVCIRCELLRNCFGFKGGCLNLLKALS